MGCSILSRAIRRKWGWAIIGTICLNLLILGMSYRHFFHKSADFKRENLPPYDLQLQALPEGLFAQLKPDWRLLLLSVINVNRPDLKLHYMDVLYRKYRDHGLEIISVHEGTPQQVQNIKQQFRLSFPVLNDANKYVQRAVGIDASHSHGGIVVIDSNLRVKFSSYQIPKEDDLRILVEKHLLNHVDYAYHNPQPYDFFRPGNRIPTLQVQSLNSNSVDALESKDLAGKRLAVFLADCAPCKLANYIKQLADLEKSSAQLGHKLVALFTPNFSAEDLASYVQQYGVSTTIYFLQGEAPQLYSEYATRYRIGDIGPILISFDEAGIVKTVGPLFGKSK
jgi:hypothetical protein